MGKPTFETEFYSDIKKKFGEKYKSVILSKNQKNYISNFDSIGWKDPFPSDKLYLEPLDFNFGINDYV